MEGDAVSATIGVLVQNLISISKEEISLIRGLEGDAEKLRDTLSMIQSFLDDAQTKSIVQDAVKRWLNELEEKVFDADNVLDELNYQLLSNKRKKMMKADVKKKKVASCFTCFTHYQNRRRIALRIKKIDTSFKSINERAKGLGLQEKFDAAPAVALDVASETDSFTADPIFIGREDQMLKIVEMLITPKEEAFSVLPIVGMGGLGKTTLARKVFHHVKKETYFGVHIWVYVSREFDSVALLKKILTNLGQDNVGVESREGLLNKLQEALKAKTYLLVLDDVWNDEQHKWDDFINSWSGITSTKGNGILVTTRSTNVCSVVKTVGQNDLNLLSDEECWSIIKSRAFREGDNLTGFEDIGRSIAGRCQGLPLAANVLGGMLRDKSQDEWCAVENNWLSGVQSDENNILKVLKVSLHHLPSPSLKKCFAYCSVFPKGAWIHKEQLIELWMAEGFLQPSQTSNMEAVGNQFLKVLVNNSLLQAVHRDEYGEVQACTMHDLVHDVACSVSDGKYYKRDDPNQIPEEQAELVRALIYNGKIGDIVFSEYKSLHSLTLVDSEAKELPESIRELIHLRYLDISDTKIESLPDSIGELYHLQTIRSGENRSWFSSCLKKLPSIKYLFNLRHLYVANSTELPPQLGMLTSLQTLRYFKVGDSEGHRIVELGGLKNLRGKLEISNLEKVHGKDESKEACLMQKPGIMSVVLKWSRQREDEVNDENVLEGLQPHPNMKKLEINGFKGANFPSWILKMAVSLECRWVGLNNLMEIRLEGCEECEKLPSLGQLQNLKSLYLSSLKNVKSIDSAFYGVDSIGSSGVFPVLKRLELRDMTSLTEWEGVENTSGVEVEVFPCLEYLSIIFCDQLRSAPTQFASLKELDITWMDSELPLARICGVKLRTLMKLSISSIRGLTSLPDWLFHNNQHLSILSISECSKLIELPHGLNSLERLSLEGCDGLKSIPPLGHLSNLKSLKLSFMKNVRSMDSSFYGIDNVGNSGIFPVLKRLELVHMENLTEWKGVEIPNGAEVEVFPCLEYLDIDWCPQLSSAPCQFTSLKELKISGINGDSALASICGVKLKTLKELEIQSVEGLISLPDWLFHNNQRLSMLTIRHCPNLIELPPGVHLLSSLEVLEFGSCYDLKSIPYQISGGKVQGSKSLRKLSIVGCPVLTNFLGEMKEPLAPMLEELSIWPWDASWDSVSYNKAVNGILRFGCHTLRKLELRGRQDWETLPDQLQHLTTLSDLNLTSFGIEELPEWLCKLSSLKKLRLLGLEKLKRLPSAEAMRRLTKLTHLDIGLCSLLKERCAEQKSNDDDSQWHKISHIPNISI